MALGFLLRRRKELAVLLVVVSLGFMFFIMPRADAFITGEATNTLPNNGSVNPWLVVEMPGGNGMFAPQAQAVAYVPVSETSFQLSIVNACDSTTQDENGWVNDTRFLFTPASGISVIEGTGSAGYYATATYAAQCTSGTSITLRVEIDTAYSITTTINGITYWRVTINAEVANLGITTYYVNRFRYTTSTAGALLGYAYTNVDPNGVNSRYTGIAYNNGSSGWGWETRIAFAQTCGSPSEAQPIYFYDTDHSGTSTSTSPFWQNTTSGRWMSWEIREYDRKTREPGVIVQSGQLSGGNNIKDNTPVVPFSPDKVYVLRVFNINYVNSLQIALPYEQINALDVCDSDDTIACSMIGPITVAPGGVFSLPVTISKGAAVTVPTGSPTEGVHLGVTVPQDQGGPVSWNARGNPFPDPPPDEQTVFEPQGSGLTNVTYYEETSGGFTYKRYYVNDMGGASNTAVFDVRAPSTTGSRTLVVRILDRLAGSWEGSCQVEVFVVQTLQVTPEFINCTTLGFRVSNASSTVDIYLIANGNDLIGDPDEDVYIKTDVPEGLYEFPIGAWQDFGANSFSVRVIETAGLGRTVEFSTPQTIGPCARIACGAGVELSPMDPGTGDPITVNFTFSILDLAGDSYTLLSKARSYSFSATVSAAGIANTGPLSGGSTVGPGMYSSPVLTRNNLIGSAPGSYTFVVTVSGAGLNPSSLTCNTVVRIANKPYVRFYGNDVFAGGGYGTSCSSGFASALGYGVFTGAPSDQSTYLGAASELAVLARNQINFLLPGSQRNRGNPSQLAFANDPPPLIATGTFGGGFGNLSCAFDYVASASSVATDTTSGAVNVTNIPSGVYRYNPGGSCSGNITLRTGVNAGKVGIPNGRRVVIYICGDAYIRSWNSSPTGTHFGFGDTTWGSIAEIPSLYVIASGNIYIDYELRTMDGVYIAQPAGTDKGEIFSCSSTGAPNDQTNPIDVLTTGSADAAFIHNNCNRTLTVNGAFIAKRVHFIRSLGTVRTSTGPYEPHTSPNIAEVFRYTPDLFLTNGGGLPPISQSVQIDSIVSLPPNY
jgi:hypothetical protein